MTRKGDDLPVAAYLGFDATAKSLHVGSLVQIMLLRHLQKCGHKPIILVGGGTTKIGDPSGKDESRGILSEEAIQENITHITRIFEKYITIGDGPTDAVIVNNAEWLDSLNYLDFLRTYGPFFTINRMLSFESVKQRLDREQPLTFLEFNYMLLQAYDFLELYRSKYKVRVQIGGSDQWGNIINGIELGRKCQQAQLYGITAPLITNSAGKKMGKSASGAVWLDKDLLSEFEYWQFWRNTPDEDVERFLYLFTELTGREIDELLSGGGGAAVNMVKIRLADEVTRLLHGEECLEAIHATVRTLYASSSSSSSSSSSLFSDEDAEALASLPRVVIPVPAMSEDAPELTAAAAAVVRKINLVDILLTAKLASSKADAKRQISAGSIRINNEKCTNLKKEFELTVVASSSSNSNSNGSMSTGSISMKVSSGKKKHVVVVLEL
jgi:tyrosyl-tRNA synthetase